MELLNITLQIGMDLFSWMILELLKTYQLYNCNYYGHSWSKETLMDNTDLELCMKTTFSKTLHLNRKRDSPECSLHGTPNYQPTLNISSVGIEAYLMGSIILDLDHQFNLICFWS